MTASLVRYVLLLALGAAAVTCAAEPPRFDQYPVNRVFTGTPARPRLVKPEERRYRTVIREGVSKGYGVWRNGDGDEMKGPNFAGRFIAIQWGCGSDCLQMALVDAGTGAVYPPPDTRRGDRYFESAFVEFRLNSRLLVMRGCLDDSDRCRKEYYLWTGSGFRHVFSFRGVGTK